ncbi:hypothetical protein [Methylobacterium marchantiae]|uniref:Small secreted protein n=1 Tax=Methylobacterium marchantiae TaxID=600331 RepID=A0ABW3WSW3_9HYPH|nr:hypothetical protein AIGOOFII_2414 [Methylobacterium marchantiae]
MSRTTRAMLAASLALGVSGLVSQISFAQSPQKAPAAAKPAPAADAPAPAPQAEEQKEIALTQAQIDGLVIAQPELAKLKGGNATKPDPKIQAKAEAIAKKSGFAGIDELQDVADSIEAVLEGVDSETKTYVGVTPLLKKQVAAIEADKKLPAKDKAAALKELNEAIAAGEPTKPSDGNIALVTKNLDKLGQVAGGGQ